MKFIRFSDWSTGLVLEGEKAAADIGASLRAYRQRDAASADRLIDLFPEEGRGSWTRVIAKWGSARKDLRALLAAAHEPGTKLEIRKLTGTKLQPPMVSRDSRTFAIGANSVGHNVNAVKALSGKDVDGQDYIDEKLSGVPPFGFSVHPDLIVGHRAVVAPPKGTTKFDYESEVGIILKRGGMNIPPSRVQIWGFMPWNDWSIRDPLFETGPNKARSLLLSWNLMKNFETCTSVGPYVLVDEKLDPGHLRVLLRVNGRVLQDWNTADMIYSFAETVSFVSQYIALKPGDMFASGTGPGTAIESGEMSNRWLKPGDKVEVELEGAGILKNTVGAF